MGAPVAVDTPVAREGGGDAGGAGGEGVAVEEGEVGVGQVGAQLFDSDGQFAGEMGLSASYAWEQVIPDKNYKSKKKCAKKLQVGDMREIRFSLRWDLNLGVVQDTPVFVRVAFVISTCSQ